MATTGLPSSTHTHSWFTEPIAHYANGYTAVGIHSDADQIEVGLYHHASQRYTAGYVFANNDPLTEHDDHDAPAVLFLNSGKILAASSLHPGPQWASLSANAYDVIGGFTTTQVYDGSTYKGSYAHLGQTTDSQNTIWWFFREGISGTRPFRYRINQNGGVGADWTAQASCARLLEVASYRPYTRMAFSGNRIDIAWTEGGAAEYTTNSLYHLYLVVNSAGTDFTAYKSDGTKIDRYAMNSETGLDNSVNLPLGPSNCTKIYDGTTNRCWVWDCQWVGGVLQACYVIFTGAGLTQHQYNRATLSGGAWSSEAICYAGDSASPGTVGRTPQWIYPDSDTTNQTDYSPGICLDPNTADRVYVGKKYADGDVRIEQWDKSGGTWGQTTKLTGATGNGRVNARPLPVIAAPTSNIVWFSASPYTNYVSYTSFPHGMLVPFTLAYTSKPGSPTYTSAQAFPGTIGYWPFTEGSGTTIADIANARNGALNTGSVTWSTDALGPYVSAGYSSTVSFRADAVAATGSFNHSAGYPVWMGMLFQSLSATTAQYSVCFGNSASNTQRLVLFVNNAADNTLSATVVDDAGQQNQIHLTKTRDTAWHTLLFVGYSSSLWRLYYDGTLAGAGVGTVTGTRTLDRFTIGNLRRTTESNPFLGAHGCVVVGQGQAPSPVFFHADLMNGQFLATRAAYVAGGFTPWLYMPEENICG